MNKLSTITLLVFVGSLLFIAVSARKQQPAPDCPGAPKDCIRNIDWETFCDGSDIPAGYIVRGKEFQPYRDSGVTFEVQPRKGDRKFDSKKNALQVVDIPSTPKLKNKGQGLIIATDVNAKRPSPYRNGGVIRANFDKRVALDSISFFDVSAGGQVSVFFAAHKNQVQRYNLRALPGKNQKIDIKSNLPVSYITMEFNARGALLEISPIRKDLCRAPTPTPAPEPDEQRKNCSCHCSCKKEKTTPSPSPSPTSTPTPLPTVTPSPQGLHKPTPTPTPQPDPDFEKCECSCRCQKFQPDRPGKKSEIFDIDSWW